VQSGGAFDIDWDIKDPAHKILLSGNRERHGDYVFTANTVGEYSFCFENDISTLTDKLVDFDIMVESEPRREPPAKPGQISEHTSALEESIFRLNGMLMNIGRMQKQCVIPPDPSQRFAANWSPAITLRNDGASLSSSQHRSAFHSALSARISLTHCSRLFWYAIFESLAIVGMAVYVQCFILSFDHTHSSCIGSKSMSSRPSSPRQDGDTKSRLLPYERPLYIFRTTHGDEYHVSCPHVQRLQHHANLSTT